MPNLRKIISRRDAYKAGAVTGVILLVPIIANMFNETAGLGVFDFVIAGALLLITQLALVAVIKGGFSKLKRYVLLASMLFAVAVAWIQLAVGIFD